jgi:hypothetical protein
MYDFSSSEWEMMEESTLIDWQQVENLVKAAPLNTLPWI